MVSFTEIIQSAVNLGLVDVLLPFTLIFTMIFAILSLVNIFGTGSSGKKFNVIIALIMGLLVVIPHVMGTYPAGKDVVVIINTALPSVSIVVVAIVMILILIGVFGLRIDFSEQDSLLRGVLPVLALLVVVFIFGRAAGWFDFGLPNWLGFLNDSELMSVVIVILVFVIIIAFVTGGEGKSSGQRLGNMFRDLGKYFKGPPRE